MEASRKDIEAGSVFDRLTVIGFEGVDNQRSTYRCQCVCGNKTVVQAHRLTQGITRSCGCYRKKRGLSKTPEYQKLCARLRRARKTKAPGFHTLEDIAALFEEQKGKCYYCKKDLPPYHIEHKAPLCRGGADYKSNLCLACPTCNLRKHTKTHIKFTELMSTRKNES